MSSLKLDQSTDYSSKELYNLLKNVDLPEYVKSADLDDYDTLQGLPKEAFADSFRKAYPLNTPARTYVSNAFFASKKAEISKRYGLSYADKIETGIKEAATIFGISEDLQDFNTNNIKKAAQDYCAHYLGEFNLDGAEVQLYPVKTAADLTASAEHFSKNLKNYPFEWRSKIANECVKLAGELAVDDLPDIVLKYAGMFYPDFENLSQELWRRSCKLKTAEHVEMYNKLSEDLENISSSEEVMKLAETLFNVENMEGLYDNTKVASILGDPVDRIFTKSIEKVASDLSFVEAHGDKYRIADLQKAAKENFMEAFGFDMDLSNVEKLAEVFPTMPRSDIKLFEELTGIRPI
jgi:hypothetical protein